MKTIRSLSALLLVAALLLPMGCGLVKTDKTKTQNSTQSTKATQPANSTQTTKASQTTQSTQTTHSLNTTKAAETTKKTQKTTTATTTAPVASPGSAQAIMTYQPKQDHGWQLRLANKYNILKKSEFPTDLTPINNGQFDTRAAGALKQMIAAADKAGCSIWAQSLHRTYEFQAALFEKYVKLEMSKGYSRAQAEQIAATYSSYPGGSDHNLGLGVDFSPIDTSFQNTAGYRWLSAHAVEYGFVLRYPADKVKITTYSFEPWHWRYVGPEAAKEIKAKGWCLEEYLYWLENK